MVKLELATAILAFFPIVHCVVDINDYFNIKAGDETVGGCDQSYGSNPAQTGKAWLAQVGETGIEET